MRILLVHSGADLYGASRSVLRLGAGLVERGNVVMVVLPCDGPLRPELENRGIRVEILKDLTFITRTNCAGLAGILHITVHLPLSSFRLWRSVRRFDPDIIHTNTALILTASVVSKLCARPHVWHIREFFSEFKWLWRPYQWLVFFLSDRIICVSDAVASQFHDYIRSHKIGVVHDGVPRDEFLTEGDSPGERFRLRHSLNDKIAVGVVGRIKCGRKGQDVFVRAAALLKSKYPDCRFLCIGSPFPGNEKHLERVMSLVREQNLEDQFVFTGDVEDTRAAYQALDISVLPSVLPEPFGGVVLESMAMGKPVVGTAIGGTLEQIENGRTGLLVPPGDPEALAHALDLLLADPYMRRQMGADGHKKFLAEFEFNLLYEKIFSVYSELAPNGCLQRSSDKTMRVD